MNISIQPFTEDRIPQVRAFNRRMRDGGLDPKLTFPEPGDLEYPMRDGAPIRQEPFVATEDGVVRGAYYLTHERYAIRGADRWIANYRHPISEVVINKAYKRLSSALLADARQRQPFLYSVGFGGEKNPNLRRLRAEGWQDFFVPFWFKVVRPTAFLRNIAVLRTTRPRRLLLDLAAATGIGWVGIKTVQAVIARRGDFAGYSYKQVSEFGGWADELWEVNRGVYLLAAVRDRVTLNLRYAPAHPRFRRIEVSTGGRVVGWAVLLQKRMDRNPYFGDMHVGTVVDCLAAPGHEPAVARAACLELEAAGVDCIVSNQSAASWCASFRRAGFLSGPSNYIFAVSAELAGELHPLAGNRSRFHINRGDGAGTSRL